MARVWLILAGAALLFGFAPAARAQQVVVDLSKDFVAITAGFTGTEVLLFGATEGVGEVVVVVVGPSESATIRLKKKIAGIWVNGREVIFNDIPAFYQVLSTDSLDEWLPLAVREANQIGVEYLDLQPLGNVDSATAAEFRNALIRNKQAVGHYGRIEGRLAMVGGRLFRSTVFFPADVPVGVYEINTYHVLNGRIMSAQTIPLTISKTGIEADIYRVAHQNSALYGLAAIVVAVLAGLGGNALFRRS